MAIIEAENLTKNFYLGKTLIQALKGVDFEIKEEEFVAIAGPSGSGKTTLLNLLGCIDVPSSGTLKMDGRDLTHLSSNELADLRHDKLGFIFQTFNLIPVLSAFENVEYSLLKRKMSAGERRDRVMASLKEVGLPDHVNHKPEELSGGQRQRVAIARALVREPEIILADEPTANLDHQTGTKILEIMKQINQERKTVFIFSTHDPKIMETAGRIIYIMDGQIVPSGN
jgi:putative ABC transport system ATP-binding protein